MNGIKLAAGDQARVADERALSIKAAKDSDIILLDVPEVAASEDLWFDLTPLCGTGILPVLRERDAPATAGETPALR